MALPSWFVCVLGMGTVFVGLLVLVLVCQLLGLFCKNANNTTAAAPAAQVSSAPGVIPNKQELIAAVSAAVAEELGEDVSAIRIVSVKKL